MKPLLLDIDNIQRKQITRVHWCSVVDGNNKKLQPSEWMASWLWWNEVNYEDAPKRWCKMVMKNPMVQSSIRKKNLPCYKKSKHGKAPNH